MSCVLYNKEQIALASYMIKYFKQRPPDCVLFSEDNSKILIHKELMYQTQYMRSMIKSATIGCCCSQIEIMCPSLTINELETIVQFLYRLFLKRSMHYFFLLNYLVSNVWRFIFYLLTYVFCTLEVPPS